MQAKEVGAFAEKEGKSSLNCYSCSTTTIQLNTLAFKLNRAVFLPTAHLHFHLLLHQLDWIPD